MTFKKTLVLMLIMILLASSAIGYAAEAGLLFEETPSLIRPGKTQRVAFYSASAGEAVLSVADKEGKALGVAFVLPAANEGTNNVFWDGELMGEKQLIPGDYQFILSMGPESISTTFKIGEQSPRLTDVRISDPIIRSGEEWFINAMASMPGTIHVSVAGIDGEKREILKAKVPSGSLVIPWDGSMHDGRPDPERTNTISVSLSDEQGYFGNSHHFVISIEEKPVEEVVDEIIIATVPVSEPYHYKIPGSKQLSKELWGGDYWSLPIGLWDEEAIWKIMTESMTIVDGPDQRETYKLRKTPDKSTARENILGEITFISQGVHVIETLDSGWSLVETYNSSYGPNNRSRRGYGETDELMQGYVETAVLKIVKPRDDYGLLIDKLKQELYVFKEGKLFTTLSISTGKPTRQQPWNETPSGEYLMVSRVGDFLAGNLVCSMSMRINGGSLIHEVPYIVNESTGYKDYSSQERVLGEKASHGCIRVQRKNNDDGINMTWLWNNIKVNTKVLVWEDEYRYTQYPEDTLQLFFNQTGGQFYHADDRCSSIKNRYLPLKGSITYAQLDDPDYMKLTPCKYCKPPERKSVIDELNMENGF